ncbi:MAG: tetratricopeptide repeat protein [Anaerolineae bacterium]|nr:tetratricopeptide repeat protein [Anaerolineae bacterium]
MTDATRSQLQQAYRLIQQEELDQAIAILKPIVASQPNNADAWWLMANAVSEPEEARAALQNVLRLNPSNTQARELLDQLNEQFPELAAAPSGSDDVSFDDLFGDTAAPAARSGGSFNRGELEDLLGGEPEPAPVPQAAESFDEIFGAGETTSDDFGFESDPFGTAEPPFIQDVDQPTAKPDKRAGREKKPRPEKVKPPKSTPRLDALEAERRANTRTSPFLLFVLLLIIVVVVGGGLTLAYITGIIGGPRGGEVTPQATSISAVSTAETPLAVGTAAATPDTGATAIAAAPTTTTPETAATAVATPDTGATAIAQAPTSAGTPAAAETSAPNTTAGTTATAAPVNPLLTLQLAGVSQTLMDTFGKNNFPNAKVTVVQSPAGSALQVHVCANAGPALQGRINQAMDIVAQQTVKVQNAVQAAGIEVVSCARPDTRLFRAFAPVESIASYVEGGMADKSGYRASWIRG